MQIEAVIWKIIRYAVILFIVITAEIKFHRYIKQIPQQLAELVKQAHSSAEFKTRYNIQVSDEMRLALQAPLTPDQLRSLAENSDDIDGKSVTAYLLNGKNRRGVLSGTVVVSIHIHSKSGLNNYDFEHIRLKLIANYENETMRWILTSVEQQK